MGDKTRGLYDKFNVTRTDGDPDKRHISCQYFVLDVTHDPYANAALLAYEMACKKEYPLLAKDLSELRRNK